MLTVTDRAAAVLEEALDSQREKENEVLRLMHSGDQYGLVVSEEQTGDQVVEHENRHVLVMSPDVSEELSGITLDAIQTPEGVKLALGDESDAAGPAAERGNGYSGPARG